MLLFISLALWCGMTSFKPKGHLKKAQAIKIAEQFIRENGYTNFAADKSKISYETLDRLFDNIDSVLSFRHNKLYPKAYYISDHTDSWYIGFLSTRVNPDTLSTTQWETDLPGRAVIVRKDRKEVRIEHKTPLFSHFKKL